ncbi:MAG TPA: sulfatase-like hydrolase/transferase [Bacteroidales bacterium]|nr:sulfatase-like hydrolase/transferase [Bacteroidales bacterium]
MMEEVGLVLKKTFNLAIQNMTTIPIQGASLLLISLVLGISPEISAQKTERPNLILINIDDMGWRDVGFMGSKYYETPNIDKLARQGMIFNQAYAAASNSAPSRACLMTGQWTPRHGIYTVDNSDRGKSKGRKLIPTPNNTYLSDSILIFPELLKRAGYTICHAGKWHLSDDPLLRGFDVNIGGCHAGNPGSYYPPYKNVPLDAPGLGIELNDEEVKKHLRKDANGYFEPTPEWDQKRSHDRLWS